MFPFIGIHSRVVKITGGADAGAGTNSFLPISFSLVPRTQRTLASRFPYNVRRNRASFETWKTTTSWNVKFRSEELEKKLGGSATGWTMTISYVDYEESQVLMTCLLRRLATHYHLQIGFGKRIDGRRC